MSEGTGNQDTLELLFELSRGRLDFLVKRSEAIETLAMGVFGIAALALTVFATLWGKSLPPAQNSTPFLLLLAGVMFLLATIFSGLCFLTRGLTTSPNPKMLVEHYASLSSREVKTHLLYWWGEEYQQNLDVLRQKGFYLRAAVVFTAAEVLSLVALFVF